MILKLGMEHRILKVCIIKTKDVPWLTLTCFTAENCSNVNYWEKRQRTFLYQGDSAALNVALELSVNHGLFKY